MNEKQSQTLTNKHIFDELLYEDRSVIKNSNTWLDKFNALLIRFEYSVKKLDVVAFYRILGHFLS